MPFPEHIERVFEAFGIAADTKATLYDLYVSMGPDVLEVFSDIAEGVESPATLRPEHCADMRRRVVERYLTRNHPLWLAGTPTPSLYCPRELEGRAAGVAIPLGAVREVVDAGTLVGEDQPVPDGVVVHGRNAHFGGRLETVSFDVIASRLGDALALARAAGQQHTLPGSVGETSGTVDAERGVALIWEVQPNVYKPAGDRNREVAQLFRRHRNWHLLTLAAAVGWLRQRRMRTYVLRGAALAPAHEVNPAKPVSEAIAALHDRTVARVVDALGLGLAGLTPDDEQLLTGSRVMNASLQLHVGDHGLGGAMQRIA